MIRGSWKIHRLALPIMAMALVAYGITFTRTWTGQPHQSAESKPAPTSVGTPPVEQAESDPSAGKAGLVQGEAPPLNVPATPPRAETEKSRPSLAVSKQATFEEVNVRAGEADTDGGGLFSPLQIQKLHEIESLSAKFGFSQSDVLSSTERARSGRIFDKSRSYNNTDEIARLWGEGKWEDALAIGGKRLAENPNDLAGLVIQAAYAKETGEIDVYLDTAKTLLQVLAVSNSCSVKEIKPSLVWNLSNCLTKLRFQDPELLHTYKDPTRRIPNYPFVYEHYLRACESDGLF